VLEGKSRGRDRTVKQYLLSDWKKTGSLGRMSKNPKILIIDDEESICWGLARLCQKMSLDCVTASSAEAGLKLAREQKFQVVIMDVRLPGMDGLTAIRQFHEQLGPVPIIIITAFGDLATAISAIQNNAFEYIVKPFELQSVEQTLNQAVATWRIANETPPENLEGDGNATPNSGLIGSSAVMQEVFKQIALTTTTRSPVLILGESGTGKELTARAIHRFSSRSAGPFVAVNLASINPALAESELFGHVQGAYTGAETDRMGLVQQAAGGTLFLDEVAEIPLDIQVKLLRVLDQNEVTPVGSNRPVRTDFRLLSATHQDLLARINHGEFRHDLFYRLRTIEIRLPPLREHPQDIPALVHHFLAAAARPGQPVPKVSTEFMHALQDWRWPGNVRELRNVVERAAVLARGGVLTDNHIENMHESSSISHSVEIESQIRRLVSDWLRRNWEHSSGRLYEHFLGVVDPAIFQAAYELSDRQYSAAARKLGIHRTTLKKKLEEQPQRRTEE
jgi:two-component system nitrogen regulation response regulator GlnG